MYKPFLDNYAYGWDVSNASFKVNDQSVQVIRHGGGINGFSTQIARFPKEKNLIVILDNTAQNTGRLTETLTKILYNQPYEPPKMSIVPVLEKTINEKGIEAGIAQYRDLKAKQSITYDFAESELNTLGYRLMRNANKVKEAVEIFKLNVEAYPNASNTYDSLAEAYLNLNERELAISNYKKAIELDPKNTGAVEALKRIEKVPVTVDAKVFDTYVGEYELRPGFVMRVYREGEKFMTQASNQNPIEVFAESETVFYPKVIQAKLTFLKDAEGKVTGLQLNQGGRELTGKKIK